VSPASTWGELVAGNERFAAGRPAHPKQGAEVRAELLAGQKPMAVVVGCSDSRVPAELVFDTGLGDLFVVRNAGQVVSASVLASAEYAVEVLGTRLIVVLSHDECGAVGAAVGASAPDASPLPAHIAAHVAPIAQAARIVSARDGVSPPDAVRVRHQHLAHSVQALVARSELLALAIAEGRLAIVGANYRLREGLVEQQLVIGDV
jgi:carbonic anhydrase